jgi:hypothetical protein
MKGIVFTELLEMVEQQHSLALVDQIITDAAPPHGGAYTSVGTYPAGEMVALVCALSARTGAAPGALLEAFGEHLAVTFARMFPQLFAASGNALDFIAGVETYVHVEVRKLYPEAELPRFDIERPRPGALAMHYRSPRAMPELAVGIIRGIGKHYAETLEIRREDLSLDATSVRLTVELVGP